MEVKATSIGLGAPVKPPKGGPAGLEAQEPTKTNQAIDKQATKTRKHSEEQEPLEPNVQLKKPDFPVQYPSGFEALAAIEVQSTGEPIAGAEVATTPVDAQPNADVAAESVAVALVQGPAIKPDLDLAKGAPIPPTKDADLTVDQFVDERATKKATISAKVPALAFDSVRKAYDVKTAPITIATTVKSDNLGLAVDPLAGFTKTAPKADDADRATPPIMDQAAADLMNWPADEVDPSSKSTKQAPIDFSQAADLVTPADATWDPTSAADLVASSDVKWDPATAADLVEPTDAKWDPTTAADLIGSGDIKWDPATAADLIDPTDGGGWDPATAADMNNVKDASWNAATAADLIEPNNVKWDPNTAVDAYVPDKADSVNTAADLYYAPEDAAEPPATNKSTAPQTVATPVVVDAKDRAKVAATSGALASDNYYADADIAYTQSADVIGQASDDNQSDFGLAVDANQASDDWLTKGDNSSRKLDTTVSTATDRTAGGQLAVDQKTSVSTTGANSKTTTLAPKDASNVIKQVADHIESLAAARPRNGVTIHLQPFDLGSITMQIKSAGKSVEAHITATHEGVREALAQRQAELTGSLSSRGFDVRHITVTDSSATNAQTQTDTSAQSRQAQWDAANERHMRFASDNDGAAMDVQTRRNFMRNSTGVDFWI